MTLLAAVSLGSAPANAATTVSFGIAGGTYAPTSVACAVGVANGADGAAVLAAAKAKACIVSYQLVQTAFGRYVRCINEICGDEASGLFLTYWGLYVDGRYASFGIDDFAAGTHRELVLSYVTWATCLTPIGCDNQP